MRGKYFPPRDDILISDYIGGVADQKKSECGEVGKPKHQIKFHCLALGVSGDDLFRLFLLFCAL